MVKIQAMVPELQSSWDRFGSHLSSQWHKWRGHAIKMLQPKLVYKGEVPIALLGFQFLCVTALAHKVANYFESRLLSRDAAIFGHPNTFRRYFMTSFLFVAPAVGAISVGLVGLGVPYTSQQILAMMVSSAALRLGFKYLEQLKNRWLSSS